MTMPVTTHQAGQPTLTLTSDPAGCEPVYLYCPPDAGSAQYSTSLPDLLAAAGVALRASTTGLSFMLQSGLVPPPFTVYEHLYLIGSGDQCELVTQGKQLVPQFSYQYPFARAATPPARQAESVDHYLELLAQATISRVNGSEPTFLFHSAGKDSNTVALALAEAGWQDRVELITQRSGGKSDESQISQKIARQLGFKHRILEEITTFDADLQRAIDSFQQGAPLPCLDPLSLVYALYPSQCPDLRKANIIDGGGNDRYLHILPTKKDHRTLKNARLSLWPVSQAARRVIPSHHGLMSLLSTPAERFGLRGFSYRDACRILPDCEDALPYWLEQSRLRADWDVIDFKTDVKGRYVAAEMHIRKARNAADAWGSNLILPHADAAVVDYCRALPEARLFDAVARRNKVFMRDILKDRLQLDSDALGKLGFSYNSKAVVVQNWNWIETTILRCPAWNAQGIQSLTALLKKPALARDSHASRLVLRLFLLSGWYTQHFG